MMMMTVSDDGEDISVNTALLDVGLILKDEDRKVIIEDVIPEMAEGFGENMPEKDDIITGIQGESLEDPEKLREIYEGIKNGEKVVLTLSRQGKEVSADFVKKSECSLKKKIIKK
jgi:S1-C subfamily serine protease